MIKRLFDKMSYDKTSYDKTSRDKMSWDPIRDHNLRTFRKRVYMYCHIASIGNLNLVRGRRHVYFKQNKVTTEWETFSGKRFEFLREVAEGIVIDRCLFF